MFAKNCIRYDDPGGGQTVFKRFFTSFSLGFVRSGSTVFRDIDTLTFVAKNCIRCDDPGGENTVFLRFRPQWLHGF